MESKAKEALISKVEALHEEEKYDEMITSLEEVPREDMDYKLKGLLARALMGSDTPDWMEARQLLWECGEEDLPGWNFLVGYNYYHCDQIVTALMYFQDELEKNPEDANSSGVKILIDECKKIIRTGTQLNPFNNRARVFWEEVIHYDEILQEMFSSRDGNNEYAAALEVIYYLLDKNGIGAAIELQWEEGIEKPELTFSPEGILGRAMVIRQLLQLAPKEVTEKYDLVFCKQRDKDQNALEIDDISLDGENTSVAYVKNDNYVTIYLKNKDLLAIQREDEESAMAFGYLLTDTYLGEVYCMRNVDSVIIADESGVEEEFRPFHECIDELLDLFEPTEQEDFPYDNYMSYQMNPKEDVEVFREDIMVGSTCIPPLMEEYFKHETTSFDEAFDQGVTFLQLIVDREEVEDEKAFEVRDRLETLLTENQGDTFRIIGSAMGEFYAYMDLVIFDIEHFRENLLDELFINPLQEWGVKGGYIQVFRYGENSYTMFDDEEEVEEEPIHESPMGNVTYYSPKDFETVEKFIEDKIGPSNHVFHELVSEDIHVDIHRIQPSDELPFWILVTQGMGAVPMNVPEELKEYNIGRAELMILLPPDWNLESEEEKDYWPIRWLKILAHLPIDEDTWLGSGHTIENEGSFAEEDLFGGIMLVEPAILSPEDNYVTLENGENVQFYQVVPLYREEIDYKLNTDAGALLDKMEASGMPYEDFIIVNIHRKNACPEAMN